MGVGEENCARGLKRKILLCGEMGEKPERGEKLERGNLETEACSPTCRAGCLT